MVGEVFAGLGAFKSMLDIAKGLKNASDAAVRNAVAIELQEKILSAQAAQMTLIEKVSELEAQVTSFKTWGAEKQRYKLTQFAPGVTAYVLKRSEARGEPGHALCTNCYEQGTKSIIQFNNESLMVRQAHICPSCKTAFKTVGYNVAEYAE